MITFHSISYADTTQDWQYDNDGATKWGKASLTCDKGKAQSPINIISNKTSSLSHSFELEYHEKIIFKASVIDNGHSIKITPKYGPYITLNNKDYVLLQFHYHGKSEHSVDGKFYDLVVHAVFENIKTKELAVIGIFYQEGKQNKLLKKILNKVGSTVFITKELLPKRKEDYYHYVGSLTTPPCSENVQWYILKNPEQASKEQIDSMRKYYVNNFRPIQELNNRLIETH